MCTRFYTPVFTRADLRECSEVLEAWDLGVASMKPGERSIFTVHPSLAFGEEGAGEEPVLVPV